MQKFMTLLVALTFITTASAAFAASNETEYETQKNGGYKVESTSEVTTPNGTDKSASHKVDVEVDDHGNVKKTVEHTKTVDPKGLMNKTSTTTKTVNGKVVE